MLKPDVLPYRHRGDRWKHQIRVGEPALRLQSEIHEVAIDDAARLVEPTPDDRDQCTRSDYRHEIGEPEQAHAAQLLVDQHRQDEGDHDVRRYCVDRVLDRVAERFPENGIVGQVEKFFVPKTASSTMVQGTTTGRGDTPDHGEMKKQDQAGAGTVGYEVWARIWAPGSAHRDRVLVCSSRKSHAVLPLCEELVDSGGGIVQACCGSFSP